MKRHLFTVIFFFMANLYFIVSAIEFAVLGRPGLEEDKQRMENKFIYALKFMFQSQGLLLPLVRMSEPFFFRILGNKLAKALPYTRYDDDEEEEEMAPLFSFLTSSLNVELVYIILKGITQFSYINKGEDAITQEKSKNI